jgi:glycosyltransferase involved in cell wall biosynthesis
VTNIRNYDKNNNMIKMRNLLHQENLEPIPFMGEIMAARLHKRAGDVAFESYDLEDPSVSIVIRSRNNVEQLEMLFEDIKAQAFSKEVELVVVDTESTDGTKQLAWRERATLVNVAQDEFSYPKALNRGFDAASGEWVFSFVDHSTLSNRQILRTATRWGSDDNVAAAYGMTLPNANASRTELLASAFVQPGWLAKSARQVTSKDTGMGFMASNCAVIRREAWSEVGGFNEAFGAGGEDGALGKALLAVGHDVIFEPALSVHHTHGLGPINSLRQLLNWSRMGKPREFKTHDLSYRADILS